MKSKWKFNIDKLKNYRIDENGDVWRVENVSKDGLRNYGAKRIAKSYPNRYYLAGQMWSQRQLKPYIIDDDNPIPLGKQDGEPF